MFLNSISTEDVNKLPQKYFEGEIFLIDGYEKLHSAVALLKQEKFVGFDTETKPSFKKGKSNRNPVALLQLATSEKAFLFRLNKINLPDEIIDILNDANIIKAGVAVREDIRILQRMKPFSAVNFIDLQDQAKKFKIENFSLKKIAAIILQIRISKSQRLSDWDADELNIHQQKYAATDAWACCEIYRAFMQASENTGI
ncbi:MAG: 3'-5' exonuclease domain-containing protein 2 [Bacteroidia bacterium]|nr:3'-5' exonuclease domain-containing protein 2 [Bacteroidia bacterium]